VWNTQTVLLRAVGSPQIPDKATMERLYLAMLPRTRRGRGLEKPTP
jgi:hypothetical protein